MKVEKCLFCDFGTKDSGTGEAPGTLLSWLLTPIVCRQSKSLEEQYIRGCRYFDLKVRLHDGKFHLAKGRIWRSSKTLYDALRELNKLSEEDPYVMFVSITLLDKVEYPESIIKRMRRSLNLYKYITLAKCVATDKEGNVTVYNLPHAPRTQVFDGNPQEDLIQLYEMV